MGAIKNGIFFFLLSKILTLNCNTATNSIQYNERNSGAPNSWTGSSLIRTPETSNYYNRISSYPPQNTYLNNNNNQPPINYEQQSPVPQQYNELHQINPPQQSTTPQQFIPQKQNFLQPMPHYTNHQIQQANTFQPETPQIPQSNLMHQIQPNAPQSLPPGSFNSNRESVHQQQINMQYPKLSQNLNTEFKQPIINQNNENQQSQPNNLYPTLEGGQGASQSIGTIKPPKEYQKQFPTSLSGDYPINEELPDFGEFPDFEVMSHVKNQENKPVQVLPKIVPQLSKQTSFNSESNFPSNTLLPQTQLNLPQFSPSIPSNLNKILLPQMPSQVSSNPSDMVSSTPNENTIGINDDLLLDSQSDISDGKILPPKLLPQTEIKLNLPQFDPSIPSNLNTILLPQMPSQLSSNPSDMVSSTPNENTIGINDDLLLDSQSDISDGKILPPKLLPQTEIKLNLPQFDPSIPSNLNTILLPQMPSQLSSNPSDMVSSTPNENTIGINDDLLLDSQSDISDGKILPPKLLPQTEIKLPLLSQSSLELLDRGLPTISKNTEEIEFAEPIFFPPIQNQLYLPQSSTLVPPISNQVPSLSYSELFDKGPSTPYKNTMQDTNESVSLNSISGFLDNKSEPLISNAVENENILMDNSRTDMQTFLNPEKNDNLNPLNNVSENQDDSQLELNDTPPELLMDNKQVENVVINNPLQDDLRKDISLNDDTQKLQNALNESPLTANVIDTQLNQELILEKAKSELPVIPFNEKNEDNDALFSLENLVFDQPLEDGLSKYDKPYIVDTENPENTKQDNAKITEFADPNDVHTLLISPIQSSTSDNNYPNNDYLLNSPPNYTPWYKTSFPNIIDYVQQPDSYANNQLLSPLLNVYQNPLFSNKIPLYPSNNNDYNQQDAYSAVGQNQMSSKIQLPGISLNDKQPSYKHNSGYIYKKVDLKNPPSDTSNSWSLVNKDHTKNSNQNNGYTSYDGITRTSISGMPSTSYRNNNQGILNLPLNDMFVQNMMSEMLNSLHVPLVSTKAIFDVTRANFPRASLSHVIRLTSSIVQSVMHSLQQTMNTVMNNLYGRRSKRDPSEVLYNLPGTLIDKYSQQSTTTQREKNMNIPYYSQPYTTGQQPMLQQQQTYYSGPIDMNYYGSQDNNNNIRVVSQTANIENYVLNNLIEAITSAIRSNVPEPYSIDTLEIDNILNGRLPTINV